MEKREMKETRPKKRSSILRAKRLQHSSQTKHLPALEETVRSRRVTVRFWGGLSYSISPLAGRGTLTQRAIQKARVPPGGGSHPFPNSLLRSN